MKARRKMVFGLYCAIYDGKIPSLGKAAGGSYKIVAMYYANHGLKFLIDLYANTCQ
jgi:hypothetical protein